MNDMESSYDRMLRLEAELREARAALGENARQKLTSELTDEEREHADFEGAYDIMIRRARADIEARVLKEIAFRIRDVFPESSRIIELSAANLAALVA